MESSQLISSSQPFNQSQNLLSLVPSTGDIKWTKQAWSSFSWNVNSYGTERETSKWDYITYAKCSEANTHDALNKRESGDYSRQGSQGRGFWEGQKSQPQWGKGVWWTGEADN